jgi:hypothetical protein
MRAFYGRKETDPLATDASINVKQFVEGIVGARSRILHGTLSTLMENVDVRGTVEVLSFYLLRRSSLALDGFSALAARFVNRHPRRPCLGLIEARTGSSFVNGKSARRRTANSAETTLTAVMAVPLAAAWRRSTAPIGAVGQVVLGKLPANESRRSIGAATLVAHTSIGSTSSSVISSARQS